MNTYTHWHLGSPALKYEGDWNIPILTPIQLSPEWGVRGDQSVFTDVYMKGLHDGNRPLGRYLLTNDGEARKLDPKDSSKYLDGSLVNEEDGDVMVYLPKLYYKVTTEDFDGTPCEVLHCSVSPISGGRVTGGTYLGAYMASMDSEGKLHSRSNDVTKVYTTIQGFHDAAKKNGERYGIMSYMQWCQLMMIQLSAYGSPDAWSKVGNGGQHYGSLPHGFTKTMGDQSGSGKNDSVNFFGLENLWCNNYLFLQGISGDSANDLYIYDLTRLVPPEDLEDTLSNRSDYRTLSLNGESGFCKHREAGEYFDLFSENCEIGGSSGIYWTDYIYQGADPTYVLAGGYSDYGSASGLGSVYADTYSWSNTLSNHAARLACFPDGCPVY